jgi:RimJ/RimL family protein N-acetyltransferase
LAAASYKLLLTMPKIIQARTERLQLRQWRADDRPAFAAMSADPEVMKYFASTLSRSESDALADRCEALIEERGWGLWAVQLLGTEEFMGFIGLHIPRVDLPFSPCVEIGWRLARPYWGHGYATEGAAIALKIGFEQLDLEEIVSFAVVTNHRSRAVMTKLNMIDTSQNFKHPSVPEPSHLREHCLYKISRSMHRAR